ncbi:Sugar lactone lactonase YvrE [Nitrosomonas marina]|uniref:Sugar lactone lactonase YvrE n=1 Tax=Nitrosomonas marina TaxID=917 RepID=A0A1H9Z3G0_9PROT|nr:SMP-30/gluconolactonase/LRE family protein [Nitrosomonas marina]SES75530.1 Sugar lactone lactonase YvrE [Nitrosomonas marina]
MKKILAILLIILVAYFLFWPVPIEPVSWNAPGAPGYTGPHTSNDRLAELQLISLNDEEGPEHVAMGEDGKLYIAVASGNILRLNPDGTTLEIFAHTGGRVLGFDFDSDGNLIAADAMQGILSISPNGNVTMLADHIHNDPIRYPNSVVVASNGMIYITDSSGRFAPSDWGGTFEASMLDIVEQSATGRVLEYNPKLNQARIVARGLSFANGIVLSSDEQTLFVNETGRYRVWKIAVGADNLDISQQSPLASILFDNLPGYPDNLMRGDKNRIWLGFAKPRNTIIDFMADKPLLRKIVLRFPRIFWPMPETYGHVMAFTEDGKILHDLQDPTGAYPETTSVTETENRLYIQSLHASSLGWLAKETVLGN